MASGILSRLIAAAFGVAGAVYPALAEPASGSEGPSVAAWEASWTRLLETHVDERGRIDFAGLAADRAALDGVVAFIAKVDPESAPALFPTQAARIAYYINAYNALAMHGVLQAGVPKSFAGVGKITFFVFRHFELGGRSLSLYGLENRIIRPLGEPRVHFALNCMVVGCPRLPRAAFTAAALDGQLAAAAHEFLAEPRNVRRDDPHRIVWLSAIFKFYTEDFLAKAPSLLAYVNLYRDTPLPTDYRVKFLDYDWTINDQSPKESGSKKGGQHG